MFKHILVPSDGSELSKQAASKAIEFAKESGAALTFFHARPIRQGYFLGERALFQRLEQDEFEQLGQAEAKEILDAITASALAAGVQSNSVSVASDAPYEAIIQAATDNGCDVIFMASHGRRGISGLLLGSETVKVLTHSRIPVLVYR
ncbi:universal stress protein [Dechloromonas sp. XY25]|uniref:Universal stress protein n=1 Tax=Dechloromonas hankyongensis TaxID=2908002 RepID=A0ABS9JX75_9RHOO|nr:universal stress protein [Dechloromonas hankyongensis]MCG2575439.1 universal stress protein [Dechloromonas hankyongensis]